MMSEVQQRNGELTKARCKGPNQQIPAVHGSLAKEL